MKYLTSLRNTGLLVFFGFSFLLFFPGFSPAEHSLPGMAPAPGEYPDVRGIPCGSWMATFTLTEKCEELEAFFTKMEPLADQGNPTAQTLIGLKYLQYPQTAKKAAIWIQKAADQGFAPAQYELGLLYENGSGGAVQNRAQAYKWFSLALKKGEIKAEAKIQELEKNMPGGELTEARKLVEEWQPKPFEKGCPEKQEKTD